MAMAENTLLEKVLSLQDKYKKLEEQLADPEVIGDMKKFVQLNKDYKELQPIIAGGLFRLYLHFVERREFPPRRSCCHQGRRE